LCCPQQRWRFILATRAGCARRLDAGDPYALY
jgi:hypothetical protein